MAIAAGLRAGRACASLYFVLSGACGLVYEVLWFKRFAHVWGSSSLAMASVVASFLAGLGLGAWLLGPRADRMARPLIGYGWCELGIALWAVLIPWITPWCARLAAAATPALEDSPLALTGVRVLTTFVAIAPACILMGATLPMLVRWLASLGSGVAGSTAWLYAANAAGAAGGAAAAGFWLLPAIGLDGTNYATAAVSAAVGFLAFATDRLGAGPREVVGDIPPFAPEATQSNVPARSLAAAAALSGFGSLVLQMLWGRELALLVGPTTYAFSALVVVFIAGLGGGSLLFSLVGTERLAARRWIAGAVLAIVVGTLAGRLAEPWLAKLVGTLLVQRASPWFNAALCSGVSAALELVATFAMGAFFPALVALAGAGRDRAGSSVGRVYAWNTVGAIVGALCTFPLLVPALGGQSTLSIALVAYVIALLLVLHPTWRGREVELGAALLAIAAIASPWRSSDPRPTNLGMYLYGPTTLDEMGGDRSRIVHFAEGSNANVLALQLDSSPDSEGAPPRIKNLRVNGKVDASNWADMPMQLGTAYFPLLLRPDARKVLVIGMGSGTTVGAALAFPDTQVTCCELEAEIVEGARTMAPENKDPHSSPRFHPVFDDGRNHVQAHEELWDLVISEPSNPWIAGISNLYTREFYEIVRSRLNRGGMFVQWIQTYALSARRHALVANTVLQAFPHVALLRINQHDTLLLCAMEPIVRDAASVDRAQALLDSLPDVADDLRTHFGSSDARALLLSVLMLDTDGVRALAQREGDGSINTDANLRLEFQAPRDLFEMRLGRERKPMDAIYDCFDPRTSARWISNWGWNEPQIQALRAHRQALLSRGDAQKAFGMNEILLAYDADDVEAQAERLAFDPPADLEELDAAIAQLAERSPREAARVAKQWLDSLRFAGAKRVYEALQSKMPDSPTLLAGLALCHVNLGEREPAEALLERAARIDPLNPLVADLRRALSARD